MLKRRFVPVIGLLTGLGLLALSEQLGRDVPGPAALAVAGTGASLLLWSMTRLLRRLARRSRPQPMD